MREFHAKCVNFTRLHALRISLPALFLGFLQNQSDGTNDAKRKVELD
jgi:hypothetical protein